jgi:glycosyltransferase involved in cell wall biosynthesis
VKPRVALVCSGVGYVNRGFERLTRNLFDAIKDEVDVTLFKGAGPSDERETALRVPRRTDLFLRSLDPRRAVELELAAYALRLLPRVRGDRFDVVHYIEPYLGNVLWAMRRRLGLRFRLLLTDGLGLTVASGRRADVLHVLTPGAQYAAIADGRPPREVATVPPGFEAAAFAPPLPRADARRRLGLPEDARIILDVAAVNRAHKRVDVLAREVAALEDGTVLALSGALEEPGLLAECRALLGGRFAYLDLPSEEVPVALAAADVFVHAALEEGFGMAILEAMAAGLPVLVNDAPHFEWLVGDRAQLVDMSRSGSLAAGLAALPPGAGARNATRARAFDWSVLGPAYVDLYERVSKA